MPRLKELRTCLIGLLGGGLGSLALAFFSRLSLFLIFTATARYSLGFFDRAVDGGAAGENTGRSRTDNRLNSRKVKFKKNVSDLRPT